MKKIKLLRAFFVMLVTSSVSVSAQAVTAPVLTSVMSEGKGMIVGTTFDPAGNETNIDYFVGGAYGEGCFAVDGVLIGSYVTDQTLSNYPVELFAVDISSLIGNCIYAVATIPSQELITEPSNQVQAIIETVSQPPEIQQTGVLGASTVSSEPQVLAKTLSATGNQTAISNLIGLSIVLFVIGLSVLSKQP